MKCLNGDSYFQNSEKTSDENHRGITLVAIASEGSLVLPCEGVKEHWEFSDGSPPPDNVLSDWFNLLRARFYTEPKTASSNSTGAAGPVAVHCIAGYGRVVTGCSTKSFQSLREGGEKLRVKDARLGLTGMLTNQGMPSFGPCPARDTSVQMMWCSVSRDGWHPDSWPPCAPVLVAVALMELGMPCADAIELIRRDPKRQRNFERSSALGIFDTWNINIDCEKQWVG
ncbi:hypothetical protein T265_04686 [Opisthorchis viverrini]|uniref:Tyrosine specific protein phosphatases domain-containing protein n=1 Tax=Opisthorchis viverrini TaxID=6198 RepID=A0A074ZRK0_OPIVI|nr:hypothetical protein T265_04686 [Opisthorchis viverrini]KER28457.1 hypothetical protein T265_04686 [Opisthorchis viverrini]